MLVIENFLEVMDFQEEQRINYDPHHIISQRKQLNKNKPFDHQTIEGLDKIVNLAYFEENFGAFKNSSNAKFPLKLVHLFSKIKAPY